MNIVVLNRSSLSGNNGAPSRSVQNRLAEPFSLVPQLSVRYVDISDLEGNCGADVQALILCKHSDRVTIGAVESLKIKQPHVKIVYDIDDLIYLDEPQSNTKHSVDSQGFKHILKLSDIVVSSNAFIARQLSNDFGLSSVIIPTCFNIGKFVAKPKHIQSKRIIFTNGDQLKLRIAKGDFLSALSSFIDSYGYQLDVIADRVDYLDGINNVNFLGSMDWLSHKQHLLETDYEFGIVPLLSDEEPPESRIFSLGKTPIKYFEYSAAGMPAIFSDNAIYEAVVTHGKTGWLTENTRAGWTEALCYMANNASQRLDMALAAQQDVKEHHAINQMSRQWSDIFTSLNS